MLFANVCAGFIRFCHEVCGGMRCLGLLGSPRACSSGSTSFACSLFTSSLPPPCAWGLGYAGVPTAGYALWVEVGGGVLSSWPFGNSLDNQNM